MLGKTTWQLKKKKRGKEGKCIRTVIVCGVETVLTLLHTQVWCTLLHTQACSHYYTQYYTHNPGAHYYTHYNTHLTLLHTHAWRA